MANKIPEELECQLWWTLALVVATAILLGRRGYVHYVEQGKSAAQVFALRARSLPYISAWAVIAVLAVILAFFHDPAEGVGVAGVVVAEFVAVCLWRDYFGNSDFVTQYVKENKERLKYLLTLGLGMNVTEFEEFCHTVEEELVEFWRKHLKNKKWNELCDEELGTLLFNSGIESARVMTRALWEGVLFDVAAFMREWLSGVEQVRIPASVAGALHERGDADDQALFCVGIILANETRTVRTGRDNGQAGLTGRQFSAARIARRKTAAEGILHWPNCLSRVDNVEIRNVDWKTDNLSVLKQREKLPCSKERLPISVLYSLTEIIKAGYLRISPEGKISTDVTFKYSNMVFKKDAWNQLRTIERKPFRFITSATWMSGDPAFMVEQREITGAAAELDGSGYLDGVLHVEVDVDVKQEEKTWLEQNHATKSNADIWGDVASFVRPERVCFLNWPVLWMIQLMWVLVGWAGMVQECMDDFWRHRIASSIPAVFNQQTSTFRNAHDRLVSHAQRRDPEDRSHMAESQQLRHQYLSGRDRNGVTENNAQPSNAEEMDDPAEQV